MATFDEYYKYIEKDKTGKKFEKFVKWFLKNEFTWKYIVKDIWLWDEYPDRWSIDKGIDLIFTDKQSGIWAVQAKQYNKQYPISKSDIDSFISESGKKNIKGRLLIATTNLIGSNALELIENKNTFPPVKTFLLKDFYKSYKQGFIFPKKDFDNTRLQKKIILEKKEFQKKAVNNAIWGFKKNNRGQLIMACGTGKTIVTLLVMQKLNSKLTMVMLPSLLLVNNTLSKWTTFANEDFHFLCVCSDKKVTEKHDSNDDIYDIGAFDFFEV